MIDIKSWQLCIHVQAKSVNFTSINVSVTKSILFPISELLNYLLSVQYNDGILNVKCYAVKCTIQVYFPWNLVFLSQALKIHKVLLCILHVLKHYFWKSFRTNETCCYMFTLTYRNNIKWNSTMTMRLLVEFQITIYS